MTYSFSIVKSIALVQSMPFAFWSWFGYRVYISSFAPEFLCIFSLHQTCVFLSLHTNAQKHSLFSSSFQPMLGALLPFRQSHSPIKAAVAFALTTAPSNCAARLRSSSLPSSCVAAGRQLRGKGKERKSHLAQCRLPYLCCVLKTLWQFPFQCLQACN